MTAEESFRRDSSERIHLREILNDPTFIRAQQIALAKSFHTDAQLDDDALASVRILSRRFGREDILSDIALLCEPIPDVEEEPEHDYGAEEQTT